PARRAGRGHPAARPRVRRVHPGARRAPVLARDGPPHPAGTQRPRCGVGPLPVLRPPREPAPAGRMLVRRHRGHRRAGPGVPVLGAAHRPRPAGGDQLSRIPCPVETCDRPMPGSRAICGACEADIARALDAVPGVCAGLDVTLARQTSRTTAGKTSAVVPLPYDPRASEAAWVLRSTLAGWVRQLQDAKPEDGPAGTPQSMAAWLTQR